MKEITLREHMAKASRARWAGMTKEQRSEAMRHAAKTRWNKTPKVQKDTPTKSSTLPHTGNTKT